MTAPLIRSLRSLGLALLTGIVASPALVAQDGLARSDLKPYWFVFLAYALVWILVFGWIVSIGRRLRQLEDRPSSGSSPE